MEPVTSLRGAGCGSELKLKPSLKRPESLLQPAALSPIDAMARTCGQMADRRNAPMVLARTQQYLMGD